MIKLPKVRPRDVKEEKNYLVNFDGTWYVMECSKEWYGKTLGCFEYCALEVEDKMIKEIYGPLPEE